MSKGHEKFNINDYTPKRFGLNYVPPQIILEYLVPSTGKLYHHKMRLHNFYKDKPTADIMKELYDRHPLYLDKNKVAPAQIKKLIAKLKANFKPYKKEDKKNEIKKEEDTKKKEERILKVEEVKQKKAQMDVGFEKNRIKKGDEGYEYDVRKDFDNDQYEAEWDDDSY
ncbi:MAG: hypothetical protein MJ252_29535 [archaeon]|nr:hypothetical protein [archaeon]